MRHLCLLVALLLSHPAGYAADIPDTRLGPRAVIASAPGQAGYVHYFLITHPGGETEYQVGIELDDQRVAWSFPGAQVMVSPFVKNGSMEVQGGVYHVQHLYGLRPFATNAEMRALQRTLPQRVAQWIDNETPYCVMRQPGDGFCLNCGDFVVRILWPGAHPLIPALPHDFARMNNAAARADDLLIYLTGLHTHPDKPSMRARLAKLDLPAAMREDLLALIGPPETSMLPSNVAIAPKPPGLNAASSAQPAMGKPPSRIATRRTQGKKI